MNPALAIPAGLTGSWIDDPRGPNDWLEWAEQLRVAARNAGTKDVTLWRPWTISPTDSDVPDSLKWTLDQRRTNGGQPVHIHPEGHTWAGRLARASGYLGTFHDAMSDLAAENFKLSLYVGSFHYLQAPALGVFEALTGCGIYRLCFDSASAWPLDLKHYDFLTRHLADKFERIGLEGIRPHEREGLGLHRNTWLRTLNRPPEPKPQRRYQLVARLENFRTQVARGFWEAPKGFGTRLLCDTPEEVAEVEAMGHRPMLQATRSNELWPR